MQSPARSSHCICWVRDRVDWAPRRSLLVHRSISPLYFTTARNLSTISREGAKENSPGRKPWGKTSALSPKPRRGDRIWANLAASFAPTGARGEKNRKTFPFSQGLRPGLLSAALRAKENNIMNQSNDVLVAAVYRLLPRKERVLPSRLLFMNAPVATQLKTDPITKLLDS